MCRLQTAGVLSLISRCLCQNQESCSQFSSPPGVTNLILWCWLRSRRIRGLLQSPGAVCPRSRSHSKPLPGSPWASCSAQGLRGMEQKSPTGDEGSYLLPSDQSDSLSSHSLLCDRVRAWVRVRGHPLLSLILRSETFCLFFSLCLLKSVSLTLCLSAIPFLLSLSRTRSLCHTHHHCLLPCAGLGPLWSCPPATGPLPRRQELCL